MLGSAQMNNKKTSAMLLVLLMSLDMLACVAVFGPTVTPTPKFTPAPKPITVDDLSATALKSADLPAGFDPLSGNELQDMQKLQSIVMAGFPNAQVAGLTA